MTNKHDSFQLDIFYCIPVTKTIISFYCTVYTRIQKNINVERIIDKMLSFSDFFIGKSREYYSAALRVLIYTI